MWGDGTDRELSELYKKLSTIEKNLSTIEKNTNVSPMDELWRMSCRNDPMGTAALQGQVWLVLIMLGGLAHLVLFVCNNPAILALFVVSSIVAGFIVWCRHHFPD